MLSNITLRTILLRSSVVALRESAAAPPRTGCSAVGPPAPVRHYARLSKTKEAGPESQLADLPSTSLKMDYAAVPLAQTTDDVVKRLLSLELASHSEKLALKKEQLIAKVQRDEGDRNSVEVRVAILTARIRNFQEHLLKHHKVSRENSHMRRRKGFLSDLERIDAFPSCCLLGITYTFPPEYYRRATRRWLAKKAFCLKVFKEVQKQKAEQKLKLQPHQSAEAAQAPTASR
uniref:Small ribosomal subunit protein uS15m n=1 Tax=Hippocampus comes TaxID=109280 RepID=A0A3Q2XWC7_HIPCM